MWVVELNLGGLRIRRWAGKRRYLLAPDPRSVVARLLPRRAGCAA
jgi:hypothetical protein